MEKAKIRRIETMGAIFGIVFGTILHFVYEWSGENPIVGIFSAVNESVWEHNKLLFIPVLFFLIYEMRHIKDRHRLVYAKLVESILGISLIVLPFYFYTGAFGIESLLIDIILFYIAVILGKYVSYRILVSAKNPKLSFSLSAAGLAVIFLIFTIFTFNPPEIPLFQEHSQEEIQNPNTPQTKC